MQTFLNHKEMTIRAYRFLIKLTFRSIEYSIEIQKYILLHRGYLILIIHQNPIFLLVLVPSNLSLSQNSVRDLTIFSGLPCKMFLHGRKITRYLQPVFCKQIMHTIQAPLIFNERNVVIIFFQDILSNVPCINRFNAGFPANSMEPQIRL